MEGDNGSGVCEVAFLKAKIILMKNLQQYIFELQAEKGRAEALIKHCKKEMMMQEYFKYIGQSAALTFAIVKAELLLKTDTEAITGKLPFRKHDVSGSAASEETSDVGNDTGNFLGETRPVSGNEQTKEVLTQCKCVWPACNHLPNCRNR